MTKEEIKLHKLTQSNTILNRDRLDKRDIYIKNIQKDYKDIYGNRGIKFCNDMQIKPKPSPKKRNKVSFSDKIEFSKA